MRFQKPKNYLFEFHFGANLAFSFLCTVSVDKLINLTKIEYELKSFREIDEIQKSSGKADVLNTIIANENLNIIKCIPYALLHSESIRFELCFISTYSICFCQVLVDLK